ncbi:DMT family transporter [Anaerocolumna jejuensis]|nr:DMT family transporter [Anaerocolumna jejuensis]
MRSLTDTIYKRMPEGRSHGYVLLSVVCWGGAQYLTDALLSVFSPALMIMLRFLLSGLVLCLLYGKSGNFHMVVFLKRYLPAGGLGAFGYYLLAAYALRITSLPFVSIMGGILPLLALLLDITVLRKKAQLTDWLKALLSVAGVLLLSCGAGFSWNITGGVLMIAANLTWLFYGILIKSWNEQGKNKQKKNGQELDRQENNRQEDNKHEWNKQEENVEKKNTQKENAELGYEFLAASFLTFFFFQDFRVCGRIAMWEIILLLLLVAVGTILPYRFYREGSKGMSLQTASIYLNLLPVITLLPSLITGRMQLKGLQFPGIIFLILAGLLGKAGKGGRSTGK